MCSSEEQKNQVQKSYTRVETCGSFWFAMFKRYWKCFYSIFMLSRALRKGLRQPTNFWDSGKERYYSFKITQFLKDNFWSIIGHKLQLSLLRKKKKIFWDLKCPSFLVYVRSSFQQGRWDAEEFPYLIKWHI